MVRAGFGVGVLMLVACGTFIPTSTGDDPNPGPDAGSDAPIGPAIDAGDGAAPAAEHGGNGSVDPCAASYAPAANDVYVSTTGSDAPSCGTAAIPCTLSTALSRKPAVINIADGDYHLPLEIDWALRLIGGWTIEGSAWKRTCQDKQVHIIGDGTNTAVTIDKGSVTIAYVDIATKATAAEGESLYGLLVEDRSKVTLDHVNVVAAAGGAGRPGTKGTDASTIQACVGAGDGGPGTIGSGGPAGQIAFGPAGVVSTPPGAGSAGGPGSPGTAPAPQLASTGQACAKDPDTAACGVVFCTHVAPDPGSAGCGGAGGSGGLPGANGGSSIALYVTGASSVSVIAGSLTSGDGGAGGDGGWGGGGAAGAPGVPGKVTVDSSGCYDTIDCSGPDCTSAVVNPTIFAGGPGGGTGGQGGPGGRGGGGAGGSSIAWRKDASSIVDLAGTPMTTGIAGLGGAPNGPSGIAAESKSE